MDSYVVLAAAFGLLALVVPPVRAQTPVPGATGTLYLDRGEGTIAYDRAGTGPLVICVPSMGDLRAEYRFLVPDLLASGHTVVTMDVRGHGESSADWSDYTVAGVGSDILALAKTLNAGPATIVGDSMAGGAAIWAAAEAPDAVAALVLIDPIVRDMGGGGLLSLLLPVLFADPWGPTMWGWYYSTLYPKFKPDDFPEYTEHLRDNLHEPGRMNALRRMMAASKAASEARVSRVKAPAVIVMGTRDPDFRDPAAEARWLGDQLHANVNMIDGAGHYPHVEIPEETSDVILSFLRTVTVRAGSSALR
jgi:pimeloyl-ACP methyl ester carboxylesterase